MPNADKEAVFAVISDFSGKPVGTKFWAGKRVLKLLKSGSSGLSGKDILAWLAVKCVRGFPNLQGGSRPIVKREWGGVFRINIEDKLRIIGFYDGANEDFIALDWFQKTEQKLNKNQQERVDRVAARKKNESWRRNQP